MKGFYVYILASRPGGALYIGVTGDLARRVHEHRNGTVPGFTQRYNVKQLVHVEPFPTALEAIQREKSLKRWPRVWKTRLIGEADPTWRDLYEDLAGGRRAPGAVGIPGTGPGMTLLRRERRRPPYQIPRQRLCPSTDAALEDS